MLIHTNMVRHLNSYYHGNVWEYIYKHGDNKVILTFTSDGKEIPKTGDQVLHNKLVKQKADE